MHLIHTPFNFFNYIMTSAKIKTHWLFFIPDALQHFRSWRQLKVLLWVCLIGVSQLSYIVSYLLPSRHSSIFVVKTLPYSNTVDTNIHLSSACMQYLVSPSTLICLVSSSNNLYIKLKPNFKKFIQTLLAHQAVFQLKILRFSFNFFSCCLNYLFSLYPDIAKSIENCRWRPIFL